ncbi:5-methyltetrahydropteroyltriglutamate--homocysteine S-methyltransferase [Frankia sp. EAN1pec]|uniref:5-methyltetrahydropteroyltriglutamate-- homocysteine S-methyltransferase n=1 Tax=Parafrankia sp. (strain EAN1pec) TaxID=298653 RepID=UPI0012F7D933
MSTTVAGYPRIGPARELKTTTEAYWADRLGEDELVWIAQQLRADVWKDLAAAGLDAIPSNTFSFYDQVLDTAVLFDAVPDRFRGLTGAGGSPATPLETYFAMARGADGVAPLEMTKWFDTNYHYLVPELDPSTRFRLVGDKPLREVREARELGVETRPVLVGPVTFLLLAKAAAGAPAGFRPLDLLDDLVGQYVELLDDLASDSVAWVQLDEPALTRDLTPAELAATARAYARLGGATTRPRILVSTFFGEAGEALPVLRDAPIDGIGLDLVAGPGNLDAVARAGGVGAKTLFVGVVNGHNVWRADLPAALATCATLSGLAADVVVTTSCSLLHVPIDVEAETNLDPRLADRMAFARQKVEEVVLLGTALRAGRDAVAAEIAAAEARRLAVPDQLVDPRVRERLAALGEGWPTRGDLEHRVEAQAAALGLPPLPTTTIGSFPQTAAIRAARASRRAGTLDEAGYVRAMKTEIDQVVALQEDIGLDVLVHGEPERNDMVQYFAELLAGYAATEHGWVQSYGTRYVRPPILFGDVSRPEPMTLRWAAYAQSRTSRPVKGMLTGPVTMLAWSFVRDDQPLEVTARQVALALRDEIHGLEAAGIRIIQVDEPALRELLPPRRALWGAYLDWAVGAFRLATSSVAASTQIHTHMCYSEFGDIIGSIDDLDADVASVEAARSRMELVTDLRKAGYRRAIGPGVYDIHSPRVPTVDEIEKSLRLALAAVEPARLWANPDCGLKTRSFTEVEPALRNMVTATRRVRESLPDGG